MNWFQATIVENTLHLFAIGTGAGLKRDKHLVFTYNIIDKKMI